MISNPILNMENTLQVFTVKLSELENRLDPHFYQPSYSELVEKISRNKTFKLGDLVSISNETWNQRDLYESEFPYIEISEIDLSTGQIKNVKNVPVNEAPSRAKKIVREGDIIVSTTRPSRGAISPISKEQNLNIASTGFSVLREIKRPDILSKEYLFWILRQSFSLLQMEQRSSGGNYPAITEDELKRILIPVFDGKKQEHIISTLKSAIESRSQKKAEAQLLLDNIDSFLLQELGIQLPEKDNSLEARIFTTTFQKLSGKRFDPKLFDTHSQNLFASIEKSKFAKTPLKQLLVQSIAGDWGLDEDTEVNEEDYSKCLVIRATEFDNLYNLKLENDRVRYRLIKKDKLKKLDIQPNDLLIEKSGGSPDQPVGRISLLSKELFENDELCFSNFIHKIRVDESQIDPEYLFSFLKTIHNIKITEIMQSQTNGIRNLIMGEYISQLIVVPPKEEQIEIGQEANRRRFKAQRLEQEANTILEKARQKVEEMILKP
jgi:type I restriction enzyme S subunit